MNLEAQIKQFIKNPFPLWETALAIELVQNKWNELRKQGLKDSSDYSTGRIWSKNFELGVGKRVAITETIDPIQLEFPSFELLDSFYDEHGLEPLSEREIESDVLCKLQGALKILQQVKPVYDCIEKLVRTIQVLRTHDADIDLSYSHPQIPFSIFLSVCTYNSITSDLRVAESILHESSHLFLSLVENCIDLIVPSSTATFYSPWRDEHRPIRGVLHGIFVFKMIKDFYELLLKEDIASSKQKSDFIKYRVEVIHYELQLLTDFTKSEGLTHFGKELARKLLI